MKQTEKLVELDTDSSIKQCCFRKKIIQLNFVNFFFDAATPLTFTCSESAIETMGKRVKYVQS